METMYIFDYCTGTVFMHLLTDKEETIPNGDSVFEKICEKNKIRSNDAYYMITSDDKIIVI